MGAKLWCALAQQDGFRLVLAMDGVRDAIYAGKALDSYEVGKLNVSSARSRASLDIPCLDLHATLADHYARNQQHFEFAYDWHWKRAGKPAWSARPSPPSCCAIRAFRRGRCCAVPGRRGPRTADADARPAQLRTPWLSNHRTRAVAAA